MARYTQTLYNLVKNQYDLGLNTYPIHKPAYRQELNTKIINHYLMCEIAFDTAYMFKIQLNTRMNIIMIKYAKMYEALDKLDNPFSNVDVYEEYQASNKNKTDYEQEADSTSKSKTVHEDTPASQFNENVDYASDINHDTAEADSKSKGNTKNEGELDTDRHKYGYEGITQAEMFKQYTDALMHIDMLVIEELADLFMLIY